MTDAPLPPGPPSQSSDTSLPSTGPPRSLSLSTAPPPLCETTRTLEGLSLSRSQQEGAPPLRAANPPAKRRLLSRSHRGQYFSGPQRWLRGLSGDGPASSLSEGVYTKQRDLPPPPGLPPPSGLPPQQGRTYVSHTTCVLESRKSGQREQRPHVRRIFVEPCGRRGWGAELSEETRMKDGDVSGAELGGASAQDVDSDDQTNTQVSELLSSTL